MELFEIIVLLFPIHFTFIFQKCHSQTVDVWMSVPSSNIWLSQQTSQSFGPDTGFSSYTINVDEKIKYQMMDGFGASLTDASCWLIKNKLTDSKRYEILQRLFSKSGIGLSLLRQPIGASDFNWESWTYDDTVNNVDDWNLNSFSLWREDAYIRPILDAALNVNRERIKLFASPWSPPAWMKSGKHLFGGSGGYLRPECYNVYSDYFIKYLKEYEKNGTPVYAVTIQNEPLYAPAVYPGMIMSPQDQIGFIRDYLGPKIKNNGLKTKIIAYDHNYDANGMNFANQVLSDSGASYYCDGIGWHTYTDLTHQNMAIIHDRFNKDVWITEAGSGTWVGGGTFNGQFQDQMTHLIRGPRNWAKSVIFWNVALDQNGGPKLEGISDKNRGLLTIRSDATDSYSFESGYYSMGHSSKFVDPNSYRIESNSFENDVENVAYINPDNTIVLVVSNRGTSQRNIKVRWASKAFAYILPGQAAVTFKWTSSGSTQIVALRSRANQKYVSVGANGQLIASKTIIDDSVKFELHPITSEQIALKSVSKGKFVCAEDGGVSPLNANRDSVSGWEAFILTKLADGTKALRAVANNKYVCADNYGNNPLIANRDAVGGAWETFDFVTV